MAKQTQLQRREAYGRRAMGLPACPALLLALAASGAAHARGNLVANPGFETAGANGFAADWGQGEFGKVGKTLFLEATGARFGKGCLRLVGVPKSFTTCAAKSFALEPGARLALNSAPVKADGDGRFAVTRSDATLAAGIRWTAAKGKERQNWDWPGLR